MKSIRMALGSLILTIFVLGHISTASHSHHLLRFGNRVGVRRKDIGRHGAVIEDEKPSTPSNYGVEGEDVFTSWPQIQFVPTHQQLASTHWSSISNFSARGMDHLYMLVQFVLDWIQPATGLPPGIVREQLFKEPDLVIEENKGKLVHHFWRTILTATTGICLAIVVPLFGLLLCCCCCGSSKKKTDDDDEEYHESSSSNSPRNRHQHHKRRRMKYQVESGCDPCCRGFCGVHLFVFLLFITFFVICAFVTNEYVQNGLHKLPKSLNQSLDDIELYLNNTQTEVNILFRTNFEQLEQKLNESLDNSGIIVKNRLGVISRAMALDNLTEIVNNLSNINEDLTQLAEETSDLRKSIHVLQTGLQTSRENLLRVFRDCMHPICLKLKRKYHDAMDKFNVSTTLGHLPNLDPLIANITNLLEANIAREIRVGKSAFDAISLKIQAAVNDSIPGIKKQIRLVAAELSRTADDINESLRMPIKDIRKGKQRVHQGAGYIRKYDLFRYYAFLAGAAILALILFLYTCGLLRGWCKKQPSVHEYRNRRFEPQSTWPFKCGIILVFMFFGVLLLITVGLFIIGGLSDRVGCHYLEHPEDPQAVKLVEILQNMNEGELAGTLGIIAGEKPNIAEVLSRCHQNMSMYRALQLYKHNQIRLDGEDRRVEGFNVSDFLRFKERYQIEKKLKLLEERAFPVNPGSIKLLSDEGIALIKRLQQTSLGTLNFSSFADLIHHHVTPMDLTAVSEELNKEADLLPPSQIEHSSTLKTVALMLESYEEKTVKDIKIHVVKLKQKAEDIEAKAQYGKKGLRDALSDFLTDARYAQHFLEHSARREIKRAARAFVADLVQLIDVYARRVVNQVDTEVGRCEPVSRAVNSTNVAFCKEIVLPFNGFWFSMASALLFLLPSTFCAAFLAKFYRKLKRKNERRYVQDSDYSLDDEDDIPLQEHPVVAHKSTSSSSARHHGRHHMYPESSSAPSAPHTDDNWSPGAPPPHIYTRPPPYNFH